MLVYFHVSSSLVMLGMVTLTQLFAHENQATPPSLSENESLKLPKKITNFVLSFVSLSEASEIDVKVIDGAAIIDGNQAIIKS